MPQAQKLKKSPVSVFVDFILSNIQCVKAKFKGAFLLANPDLDSRNPNLVSAFH